MMVLCMGCYKTSSLEFFKCYKCSSTYCRERCKWPIGNRLICYSCVAKHEDIVGR